jgi:carbon-monoxide dehydrogenase large subunit
LSALSKGAGLITGNYDIPYVTLRARAVFSNTMCTQAYRSSGRPEVTYAIERIIDKAAHELGFDRLHLRKLNLIHSHQMPYVNAMGLQYDSGEYEKNMQRILELSDWQGSEERKNIAHKNGKLYGVGYANYVESSIGSPKERVDLIVLPDRLEVVIGTQSAGQGHETSFAQVCADLLKIPFEKIFIIAGDTLRVSAGGGTHSGRSLRHASTVISIAQVKLIERAKEILSKLINLGVHEINYENGTFCAHNNSQKWNWFELATETKISPQLGELSVRVDNEMHTPVFPNGASVCEVEIDPETGGLTLVRYANVDDVGRCINPMIVHGQTHGGIAQGVGQGLWESCVVEEDSGQPISSSLMDYAMPRFDNLPSFATQIVEVLSPTNPLGIKAGGEGGTTPALAVIMSAVEDALIDHCGPVTFSMPATPLKIWNALQNKTNLEITKHKDKK